MTVELVGNELRAARKAANYTQAALGACLGVTGSAVGQWETGATRPQWTQSARLRQVLLGEAPGDLPVTRSEFARLQRQVAAIAGRLGLVLDEMDADESTSPGTIPAGLDVGQSPR